MFMRCEHMKNLVIKRNVNFQELEETGIYSKELLQQIKEGNHKVLKSEVFAEQRKQENFMKPLLYAESNENKTYETYICFEKSLQEKIANREPELAIEIIKYKPELVKDTPISNNERVMFEAAQERPEVIEYMSSDLKHNKKFIEELSELDNTKITSYIEQECKTLKAIIENPNLASSFEFMKEAIKEDAILLTHASENLKNNYEFIKEVSMENKEVIDYVSEHTEEFNQEALKGAKESLVKHIVNNIDTEFEEEKEKIQLKQGQEKSQAEHRLERTKNSVDRIRESFEQLITYAYSEELITDERVKAHEKIIKRAGRLLNTVKEMPEDIRSMLEQYRTISEAEISKIMENSKTNPLNIEIETIRKNNYSPEDVTRLADNKNIKLGDIQNEFHAIREKVEEITKASVDAKAVDEKQSQDKFEIGE